MLPTPASELASGPPTLTRSMTRRASLFRIVAAFMAVAAIGGGIFTVVFGIVNPAQVPHAFHNAVVASLLLVLSAPPVIVAARNRDGSSSALVILAVLAIAALATMALGATVDPFTLPFVALIGVLWALRAPGATLVPAGRLSPILTALVVVAAVPLVVYAFDQAELQRIDHTSSHAAFYHWVETSFYAVGVLLLGSLTAFRPRAYRLGGWMAGLALAVLGAGSLLLPTYASALGASWAWAALVGAAAFVAIAEWEARRSPAGVPAGRLAR